MTKDQELETLQAQARAISEKISEIEIAKTRKANGAKVGKTFKTRNNYSCPEKPSDYWWVYSKVTRMDEYGMLYATEFQTDSHGNVSVRFDHYAYHMQGHRQIPESEFKLAWVKMRGKVNAVAN